MVKLINILVLASGLSAVAFSLERPSTRVSGLNKIGSKFNQAPTFQHSKPSYLKATEDSR